VFFVGPTAYNLPGIDSTRVARPRAVARSLVGHRTTTVKETVDRKQFRQVIENAATAVDHIFPARDARSFSLVTRRLTGRSVTTLVCLVGVTEFEPVTLACKAHSYRR
jgi:hypothetical protein